MPGLRPGHRRLKASRADDETFALHKRSFVVQRGLRTLVVIIASAIALSLLALVTQIGVFVLDRLYPPSGQFIDVTGARLHVVDLGPRDGAGAPIVLLHGASSNLEAMRRPLGDLLAQRHRVILIDRPGHGWSSRGDLQNSLPAAQAKAIDEALQQLGIDRAVIVVHSMAGALGARLALDYPQRVAGLVMLAAVSYPWPGGVGNYNKIITTPVIGPLLANTITLPIGWFLIEPGVHAVFLPQAAPDGYAKDTATPLLLRPREFLANAFDLVTLKDAVAEQAPRYAEIKVPVTLIAGDADKTVSTSIHSRRFAATVPGAKLIVLPNVGHIVQNAAPDLVVREVEAMIAGADTKPKAAMR
jgi:pimeloyl-ACP methyl ester carboxylesterase